MAEDMEKLIDALPKREIKPISLGHKCSFCPKTFTAMCTRKYHERSKHPEKFKDNILQFFCDECGNEFKRLWNLNNHKNSVHNTEKTFKCDAVGCGKMFKTNIARNEHTKIHTTTYKCTFKGCEKIFRSQQSYAQHLGVHKGYQFPCTFPGCNHPPFTRKRVMNDYYYYCKTHETYDSIPLF